MTLPHCSIPAFRRLPRRCGRYLRGRLRGRPGCGPQISSSRWLNPGPDLGVDRHGADAGISAIQQARTRVPPGPVGRGEHVQVRHGQLRSRPVAAAIPAVCRLPGLDLGRGTADIPACGIITSSLPEDPSGGQVKRLSDIRRRSSHHDDGPDVTGPRRTSESTRGPMTVVLSCPASSRPDSPRTAPHCRPPSLRGHGEANVEVPGVIALDHAGCPGCATAWPAAARRRRARFHLYPEPDTQSRTGV